MKPKPCRATVIHVGVGNDGRIKCFLTKESDVPVTRIIFRATIVVMRSDGNITGSSEEFDSFEESQSWLEKHFNELSIVEFRPVPKAKNQSI